MNIYCSIFVIFAIHFETEHLPSYQIVPISRLTFIRHD